MKKSLSIILSLVMLITMIPVFSVTSNAVAATNSLQVSGDGILTWDAFGDTGKYTVWVTWYSDGSGTVTHFETRDTKCNLQSLLDSKKNIENSGYYIYVQTTGNGFIRESNTITYKYYSSLEKLPAPTNVRFDGRTVRWDYSGSDNDLFEIQGFNSNNEQVESHIILGTIYPLDRNDIYYCKIKAMSDDFYLNSSIVESNKNPLIPNPGYKITGGGIAPYNVQMSEDGILSWNAFGSTGTYTIDVEKYANGAGLVTRFNTSYTSIDLVEILETRKIDSGNYSISIYSYNNGAPVSTKAVRFKYLSSYPKLDEPKNIKAIYSNENCWITWDDVTNATEYVVNAYDINGSQIKSYPAYYSSLLIDDENARRIEYVSVTATANADEFLNSSPAISNKRSSKQVNVTFVIDDHNITQPTNRFGRIIKLYNPEWDGYIFDGWYTDERGGTKVDEYTVFNTDTTIYPHWISETELTRISTVILNGTINSGDVLNDNGPLTVSTTGVDTVFFSYTKDGKWLSSNTKATYGNYDCTITLYAEEGYEFTNSTSLNFSGNSYNPVNLLDDGKIAIFTIQDIYVECNHTSSSWLNDAGSHFKMCSVCHSKFNEGSHSFSQSVSGSTITFTCTTCGYVKTGKVAETRTGIGYCKLNIGNLLVGDRVPTTVGIDYGTNTPYASGDKYYDFATVKSVTCSTTGSYLKNETTTLTVVLQAKSNYYFQSTVMPSADYQYTTQSKTVSSDGTTLTVVFTFKPYTPASASLTLPEIKPGDTYADVAQNIKFYVNGSLIQDYSISIKRVGDSSGVLDNISGGVVTSQYMYENTILPNSEYKISASFSPRNYFISDIDITNRELASITAKYCDIYGVGVETYYTTGDGHIYDSGTITKQATCTEDGEITLACTHCSDTKTMVIPAKGHIESDSYRVDPTCIGEGRTAGTVCYRCNEVLSGCETIAPTGVHTYTSYSPSHCIVCGFETVPMGDIDLNGRIDSNDYSMLVDYIQHNISLTSEQMEVADLNHDTAVDGLDAVWLDLYLNNAINIDGTGTDYLKGDVNEDGVITIEDYSLIKSNLAGTVELTGTNYYEADVNNDSAVDAFDLYYVDTYVNKCYQGRILK